MTCKRFHFAWYIYIILISYSIIYFLDCSKEICLIWAMAKADKCWGFRFIRFESCIVSETIPGFYLNSAHEWMICSQTAEILLLLCVVTDIQSFCFPMNSLLKDTNFIGSGLLKQKIQPNSSKVTTPQNSIIRYKPALLNSLHLASFLALRRHRQ